MQCKKWRLFVDGNVCNGDDLGSDNIVSHGI